ncbi:MULTISPECIES: organic hydroperoxide resistance protein [Enterobacteriaceae]|jgi:Ohr subfamily peroxiredoxin|uniref:Organic hydroperoxide resistance protein n=5 Tax=Enterobacteriaceae TaxID=543 RepID=A0AAC8TP93_9ENTR|nr:MULTISPECIES: organic hydroperoxide resistance protein [Enterobacteriaceae]AUV02747.1 organic hydroperoxide resistance protein [Enterobacteriaceae bacterium ENNIH1]MBS6736511.1 organic hydroperoxide resistance protein [Enterobacteriaceae bacterium]MCL5500698.1 organic hydroperoxide resistance protein [Escherichia coli]PXW59446.1 Ohr subfamily peroxiredoxin [Grimontella sp. AG753]QIH65364.1 organic hydroperoxide resistance protein [Enterobacteriaceae bacterium A-F18]SFD81045.1 peroxiredoxin
MSLEKVIYTAKAKATGGREGRATSSDGVLDVKLGLPKEMGGAGGEVTNPEQLFAAGYSACFLGAMKFVSGRDKIAIAKDAFIEAEVGIGPLPTGFGIEVKLNIHLEGMDAAEAKKLVDAAHIVCPYSNATRGNVDVTLNIIA